MQQQLSNALVLWDAYTICTNIKISVVHCRLSIEEDYTELCH